MSKSLNMARQAVEAHQAGHLRTAEKLYRAVLAQDTNNPIALHLLGVLLHQSGKTESAIRILKQALDLKPQDPEVHNNLGVSLNDLKHFAEAAKYLERSVMLDASVASVHSNLGVAYRGLRRLNEARASFEHSLSLSPHPRVYSNLGLVYLDLGDTEKATACFRQAVGSDPTWAQAHVHLGFALQRQARLEEALASFDNAHSLDPDHGEVLSQRCHLRQILCDWQSLHQDRSTLGSTAVTWRKSDPPSPFTILALTDDPKVQFLRARDYAKSFELKHRCGPRRQPRNTAEKIRIAYLSPDFRQHPVGAQMVDVLALHDRTLFQITALSYGPNDKSELRRKVEASADCFLDVVDWADLDVSTYLRMNQIDIAVDLAGFTTLSRPAILAEHPARIQVNYLGYPGTTGSNWIDYTIGDSFLADRIELRRYLSESMVCLPGSFQANSRRPTTAFATPSRASEKLPNDGFVFCAFSNSYKITHELFGVWMRLLLAVPASVLWLLGEHDAVSANLKREAETRGVAPERLVFARRVSYEDYLARFPLANLFLDTFPYNSGTTAADALWMGLPLLSLSGASYASRMAGSLLTDLNLKDFITADLTTYECQALRLATDPALLAQARTMLERQNQNENDLFNPTIFTRKLEAGFLAMLNREKKGLGAGYLVVPP